MSYSDLELLKQKAIAQALYDLTRSKLRDARNLIDDAHQVVLQPYRFTQLMLEVTKRLKDANELHAEMQKYVQ